MVDRAGVEQKTRGTDLEAWVVVDGTEYALFGNVDAHKHDELGDQRSPSVSVHGKLTHPDAPTQLGQEVEVRVEYRGDSERFTAGVNPRIGSKPVQLEATRGEPPAYQFTNFESVWTLVEQAYEDNH